ncbi:MAG: hypothetical protein ABSG41_18130 [Bryobacteraceae bacterium]|jgi:hypothetical protein
MSRMALFALLSVSLAFGADPAGFTTGKAELKSAGALAFGPDGILFVGDSMGGAVVAIDTGDTHVVAASSEIELAGIDRKVAALLGLDSDQILINDVKVNPISKNVYLSVSRGRGLDAAPVILRTDPSGKMTELSLDNIPHSIAGLPNPPTSNPKAERFNPRLQTITQLAYVDGKVIVAGLSNEEFSSNLRVIPFPFRSVDNGASVEIFHGSHGEYETQAPVRTFVPWTIGKERYIVAAYTCTPLVLIPVKALKSGAKVTGTTIAEFGMGNRPLDMIAYRKDDHDFMLIANSYRGVLKFSAENLDRYRPIVEQEQIAGVPYKRIPGLRGVRRLTALDATKALILADSEHAYGENDSLDLRSFPLP